MPAPRAVTITANVDTAMHYQLSADIASGYTLQWKLATGAKLPPGLGLSGTGLITGTPTAVGTYSTPVQVRAVHAKIAGPWLPATVTVTVTSASSSSGGGSWTAIPAPFPANAGPTPEGGVTGVSCPSASYCVAVGNYLDSSGNWDGLLLTWSDGAWTAAEAPLPDGAPSGGTYLYGVSCASASYCVAVGTYGGNQGGLLLTWSGGAWTASEAPLPQGAGYYGLLYGVSCPSASYCVAVGQSNNPSNGEEGLLLTLAGGSWTPSWEPLPASTNESSITAVSCPTESYCVTGGWYRDTSQTTTA